MIKIYLAGPDVFRPDAVVHGKNLVNLVSHWGMQGLYPLDNELALIGNKVEDGRTIALANMKMIQECDAVLANLEPFRGPSADPGTVWECAYAKGLGKLVWGYNIQATADSNHNISVVQYKDKVLGKLPHDGLQVEDFGTWDNIMIVYGLDGYSVDVRDALHRIKIGLKDIT